MREGRALWKHGKPRLRFCRGVRQSGMHQTLWGTVKSHFRA